MILDGIPYQDYSRFLYSDSKGAAIRSFVRYLEKKLGIFAIYPTHSIPLGDASLIRPLQVAEDLISKGIIDSFRREIPYPDEPPIRIWSCRSTYRSRVHVTGGMSSESDENALFAALAEGLERYVRSTQRDYFVSPLRATTAEIAEKGSFLAPERFVGFSDEQRIRHPTLRLSPQDSYLWIRGASLTDGRTVFIPAQIASALPEFRQGPLKEPIIRVPSTVGLATWPTQARARLAGILEIIEHDAYMIMWLNQISPTRISLSRFRRQNPGLDALIQKCARYRLKVHALRMPTDAPTYAICAVVEDMTGVGPRFTLGLRAHFSLATAVEKALLEALRARVNYRAFNTRPDSEAVAGNSSEDFARTSYWEARDNASGLEFLTRGREEKHEMDAWEDDTAERHLERLIAWCHEKGYECVAVSLGISKINPTPWFIEKIVMPDLQPSHVKEEWPYIGGRRLKEVPTRLGYTPREIPFTEAPHPFY